MNEQRYNDDREATFHEWYYHWELGMVRSKGGWLVKDMLGSKFCKQTIWLVLLARFQYIVHCFPGELSQE